MEDSEIKKLFSLFFGKLEDIEEHLDNISSSLKETNNTLNKIVELSSALEEEKGDE